MMVREQTQRRLGCSRSGASDNLSLRNFLSDSECECECGMHSMQSPLLNLLCRTGCCTSAAPVVLLRHDTWMLRLHCRADDCKRKCFLQVEARRTHAPDEGMAVFGYCNQLGSIALVESLSLRLNVSVSKTLHVSQAGSYVKSMMHLYG